MYASRGNCGGVTELEAKRKQILPARSILISSSHPVTQREQNRFIRLSGKQYSTRIMTV